MALTKGLYDLGEVGFNLEFPFAVGRSRDLIMTGSSALEPGPGLVLDGSLRAGNIRIFMNGSSALEPGPGLIFDGSLKEISTSDFMTGL